MLYLTTRCFEVWGERVDRVWRVATLATYTLTTSDARHVIAPRVSSTFPYPKLNSILLSAEGQVTAISAMFFRCAVGQVRKRPVPYPIPDSASFTRFPITFVSEPLEREECALTSDRDSHMSTFIASWPACSRLCRS